MFLGLFILILVILITLFIVLLTDYKDEIWEEIYKMMKGGKK